MELQVAYLQSDFLFRVVAVSTSFYWPIYQILSLFPAGRQEPRLVQFGYRLILDGLTGTNSI